MPTPGFTNERIDYAQEPDVGVVLVKPSIRQIGMFQKTIQFEEGKDGTGAGGTYTGTINIPQYAIVRDIEIRSSALWTAGTSADMDVGDSDDPNGYYAGIDLKATDLLVDEVINFNNLGGKDGAYITAASGSFQQTYLNGSDADGYDIIGVIVTVGTALVGRTIMTVFYNYPTITETEVVYVAT